MNKQNENSHESITWSEVGKQNILVHKLKGFIKINIDIRKYKLVKKNRLGITSV